MAEKNAYKIYGLDCADEMATLKQELADKAGILNLEFSINKTGMKAIPWQQRTEQESGSLWQRHGRLIMAVASGALLACGFLTHWIQHGSIVDAFAAGDGGDGHIFPLPSILFYIGSIISGVWLIIPKAIQSAKRLRPDRIS